MHPKMLGGFFVKERFFLDRVNKKIFLLKDIDPILKKENRYIELRIGLFYCNTYFVNERYYLDVNYSAQELALCGGDENIIVQRHLKAQHLEGYHPLTLVVKSMPRCKFMQFLERYYF